MARRPTEGWDHAPAAFVAAADRVLASFESEVRGLDAPSDAEVLQVVRRVVEGLNAIDGTHDHDIDTVDREELCEFIDALLAEAGVNLDGLAARQGFERYELTDAWREW